MLNERKYLIEQLINVGINKKDIHTSRVSLLSWQEIRTGAVLVEGDTLSRTNSKKVYINEDKDKKKRKKIFDRNTTFRVIIADGKDDKCEEMFNTFILTLDEGIVIDGNWIGMEISEIDWVDKEDSKLKSKVAVQFLVTFLGGVYKETGYKMVGVKNIDTEVNLNEKQ